MTFLPLQPAAIANSPLLALVGTRTVIIDRGVKKLHSIRSRPQVNPIKMCCMTKQLLSRSSPAPFVHNVTPVSIIYDMP